MFIKVYIWIQVSDYSSLSFHVPSYLQTGSWCPLCPGVSAPWPTILCYCITLSPQRELLILSILPNQLAHICIKISKRLKGSSTGLRVYTLQYASSLCLLNNFPILTCFSLNFSAVSKQRRSPESSVRMCLYNSMGIDLFKVANRLIHQQGQNPYWCHPSLTIEKPPE